MIKKLILLTLFLSSQAQVLFAQLSDLERVEPMNWWVGFKNQSLQLLVRGNRIADRNVSLNYAGVKLVSVQKVENPNYLFLNLQISSA
ncbi:MAG TPA: cyclomaltodextrinase N-terminal domain-containing protein, partial [Pedobacter sp.]|nr:cyclomaltodextrinase N-terminal domain-containing protein [Pedobacter sp.]